MHYRQHIQRKLENLEAKLKHIEFHNGRNNRQEVETTRRECEDLVEEIKAAIEREPMTSNEQNKY
jgi:broad-specificity NMP kinase